MNEMPLISIIVPVYNTEPYLRQCLDSLVNQTYQNLEIICVNDGSTDDSLKILEKYAEKDYRLMVISKENEGVSIARNMALERCSGNYIMFVDSDDWIETDTCQIALDTLVKYNADLVMWDYIREFGTVSKPKNIYENDIVFTKEAVKRQFHRRMVGIINEELLHPEMADALCTIWGKLYRRECIIDRNIQFIDIRKIGTYEDGLFNLHVFENVNMAVYIHKHLYHYRKDNAGSVTTRYNKDLQKKHERIHQYLKTYIEQKNLGQNYNEALYNRIALELIGYGLNILSGDFSFFEKIREIKRILYTPRYRDAYKQLKFQYLPLHWKLYFRCAEHCFATGVFLLSCCIKKIIHK